MHGLGNDFVILDRRKSKICPITPELARRIGDRRCGVGFDQMIVMNSSDSVAADISIDIWNRDGSKADACGNASRCVGRLIMEEKGSCMATLKTGRGLLQVKDGGDGLVRINMGKPELTWKEIPLAKDVDIINMPIEGLPGAVGMGNPHCVFIVESIKNVNLEEVGPNLECHPLFPQCTNVEFLQVLDSCTLRMRVWERGCGVTRACGSGACAAVVVAHRKGLTERKVKVHLDGGSLDVEWCKDGVWMNGPTTLVFSGTLSQEFLNSPS